MRKEAFEFPGKKAEVLFNMIPMLTQQGEKAGSVRIMRSVLKLLGETLPDIGTALETGHGQMAESIRSFYRFARAAQLANLEFDAEFNREDKQRIMGSIVVDKNGEPISIPPDFVSWVRKVQRATERVRLSSGEEQALDNFINITLQDSGNLIQERALEEGVSQDVLSVDQELEDIERQLRGE